MASPLDVGDQLHYSLSVDGGGFWVKLGVSVTVRPDETPIDTEMRAHELVDALLQNHVKQLQAGLRP